MAESAGEPLILFQSDDFLVVGKPAGFSVHNEKPSLQDQLAKSGLTVPHFINRLDRETSGLVVATTEASKVAGLVEAMAAGRKVYRGIVKSPRAQEGVSAPEAWSWTDTLSDKAEGRRDPLGKPKDRIAAETRVRRMGGNDWFWDLEFELKTGRQHQIRKHCAFHQVPLVGDGRYGREALNTKVNETYGIARMMLHAHRLEFKWNNKLVSFEAPLPDAFSELLSKS